MQEFEEMFQNAKKSPRNLEMYPQPPFFSVSFLLPQQRYAAGVAVYAFLGKWGNVQSLLQEMGNLHHEISRGYYEIIKAITVCLLAVYSLFVYGIIRDLNMSTSYI